MTATAQDMTAVVQVAYGGPEVLQIKQVPRPTPGAGEVLVRVAAAGMNAADVKIRAGAVGHRQMDPPFIPGLDVSGVVETVGPDVTELKPGDRVYGMVFRPDGPQAQYAVTATGLLGPVPAGVDLVQAGALATSGLTAWQALVSTAKLEAGQRVLVRGAAGGVGHLAVQIAKARGAYVVAAAGADKRELLNRLKADEIIDYRAVDLTEAISGPVDVVIDPIGDDYGPRCVPLVSAGGIFVDLRQPNDYREELRQAAEQHGVRYVDVIVSPNTADLTLLAEMAARGELEVVISATLPLEEVGAAHELVQEGHVQGKVVLVP